MGIKISVKSVGRSFFIPILFNSFLIPVIVFMVAKTGNEYNLSFSVNVLTQMFTPFFGSFVVCMHMSKYIEACGNEIYFVDNKNKGCEILKLYCLYVVTNTCWFVAYGFLNKEFVIEWVHIIIITFLYMVSTYFFCFLFNSVSLASIPIFLYTIYSIVGLETLGKRLSYYEYCGVTREKIFSRYGYFLGAACFIFFAGNILNLLFENYND